MDETFCEPERMRSKTYRPGSGKLFHTGRQVRGLADSGILHVEVVSDCTHDDFAGIQADAKFDFYAVRTAHLAAIGANRGLHRQRRVAGTHRMILVRQRRAENRHDAVTHHMVHSAFIAVYSVHDLVDNRIDELARFLRVAVSKEFHRAFEVGE